MTVPGLGTLHHLSLPWPVQAGGPSPYVSTETLHLQVLVVRPPDSNGHVLAPGDSGLIYKCTKAVFNNGTIN